jgi:hypothetical protein
MQRWLAVLILGACGGPSSNAVPPKPPNDALIVGAFERRKPLGTTAMRFRANGEVTVAKDKDKLDGTPDATGTWAVDKDQLTLTYATGECQDAKVGVYKVGLSKTGIHFTKVDDSCEQRSHIDGQTWWRIK